MRKIKNLNSENICYKDDKNDKNDKNDKDDKNDKNDKDDKNDKNDKDDKVYIVHKVKNHIKKYNSDELFEDEINSFTELKKSSDSITKSSSLKTNVRNKISSTSSLDNKKIYNELKDNNDFFNELLKKQIKCISNKKKLNYNDIKRISKLIKSSIFDKKNCSIWCGYITNENNSLKGTYINFYFNKKKIALHRLLYINYIGILTDNEYLKFSCENKGKCCNIHHMKKYTYNNKTDELNNSSISNNKSSNNKSHNNRTSKNKSSINKSSNNEISETIQINTNKDKLIVEI